MAIDFPTSPTSGQTVYLAGNAYTWNGTVWTTSTGKSAAVRQTFTAGAGQTSFTVTGGYFAGTIDVYLNGVKLVVGDDVTASDGSTVVLASGATAGDILEVVSFNSFSIANMLPLTGGTLTGALTGTTFTDATATLRPLVMGTAQATTSGTAIDFTGIPSWAERITVLFNGVSLSATANLLVQIGPSGGVETTGYASSSAYGGSSVDSGAASSTAGFIVRAGAAAVSVGGAMTISLVSGNIWVASFAGARIDGATPSSIAGGGAKTLAGVLSRVRITSTSTDTFDAGSVNIHYEG